ncbi:MAG TPA: hypothetical protein VL461_00830 [Dictyobacter sp.]|jgi:hypothetical protein|nr:hypothetical protein [Dictyobacter sp.]
MPGYAQIQTYATCNAITLPERLQSYQQALEKLGCQDQEVLSWLNTITWPESDDDNFGDVYAAPVILKPTSVQPVVTAGIEVSLFTQPAVPSIEELPSWIGFNFLIERDTIGAHVADPYTEEAAASLWQILETMFQHFHEVGVYFTDEWQENQAWRAIVENAGDPWMFDLAIFPRTLAEHFQMVPAGFKGSLVGQKGFTFAQANRWTVLPWEVSDK